MRHRAREASKFRTFIMQRVPPTLCSALIRQPCQHTRRGRDGYPRLCDDAGILYVSPVQRELELMAYRALVSDGRFRRSATIVA